MLPFYFLKEIILKKRVICFLLIFVLIIGSLAVKAESDYDNYIDMLIDYYDIDLGEYYYILHQIMIDEKIEIQVYESEIIENEYYIMYSYNITDDTYFTYYIPEYGYIVGDIIYNKGVIGIEDNPYKEEEEKVDNIIISDFFNFLKEMAESFVEFFKEFIDSDYFLLYITLIVIMLVFAILAIILKR